MTGQHPWPIWWQQGAGPLAFHEPFLENEQQGPAGTRHRAKSPIEFLNPQLKSFPTTFQLEVEHASGSGACRDPSLFARPPCQPMSAWPPPAEIEVRSIPLHSLSNQTRSRPAFGPEVRRPHQDPIPVGRWRRRLDRCCEIWKCWATVSAPKHRGCTPSGAHGVRPLPP